MTETLDSDFKNAEQKYGTYADDYTPHVEFLANRIIQLDQEKKLSPAYFLGAHMMLIADAITSAIAIKSETVHLEETRGFIKNCVKCVSDRNTQGVILDKIRKNIEDQEWECTDTYQETYELVSKELKNLIIEALETKLHSDLENGTVDNAYFNTLEFERISTMVRVIHKLLTRYNDELFAQKDFSPERDADIAGRFDLCLSCIDNNDDLREVIGLLSNKIEDMPIDHILVDVIKRFEFNAPEEEISDERVPLSWIIEEFKIQEGINSVTAPEHQMSVPKLETPKIPIKKEKLRELRELRELRKDFQKKLKHHLVQNLDIGDLIKNCSEKGVYTLKDIESLLKTWHKSEKKKSGLKRKISLALETHFPAEY